MNNSSASTPTKEAKIASIRKYPLLECGSQLEKDSIIHSKARLRASLRAILTRDVNGNFLIARQPVFASAADSLCGKTANLIRLREIFRAAKKTLGVNRKPRGTAILAIPEGLQSGR